MITIAVILSLQPDKPKCCFKKVPHKNIFYLSILTWKIKGIIYVYARSVLKKYSFMFQK